MNSVTSFLGHLLGAKTQPPTCGLLLHTRLKIRLLAVCLVFLGLACSHYALCAAASSPSSGLAQIELNSFLDYQPLNITPQANSIVLPLKPAEIDNAGAAQATAHLTEDALQALCRNGFVVVPWRQEVDMLAAYQEMPNAGLPNFITSDSLLHLYHVQFDEILKNIESREFYPRLITMTRALLSQSQAQYATLTAELREAARRNTAFLAVAQNLLGDATAAPDYVSAQVNAELALIDQHAGFVASPIFIYQEDYSQYVPRGHYTRSEQLKQYFKAMMWYGRMAFLLKGSASWGSSQDALISEEDARIQTYQAVLLTLGLDSLQADGQPIADIWNRLYAVTAFFVGLADDLTPYEYKQAVSKVFGSLTAVQNLTDPNQYFALKKELASLRNPQIFGGTGDATVPPDATPADLDKVLNKTKGMRLMGQRFVPDSYMFQNLVYPVVGRYTGSGQAFTKVMSNAGPVRGFPRGLDVMAVLGSAAALAILDREGDTDYQDYDLYINQLMRQFRSFTLADWTRNLYWGWLFSLQSLLTAEGTGYPAFMQTAAWRDKQLQTALASWAELRHDTILYAKQSYTPRATVAEPLPTVGYVEPSPEFFNRLRALTRLTHVGLDAMNVLDLTEANRLAALEQILARLTTLATIELTGLSLGADDYNYITNFGAILAPLTAGLSDGQAAQTTMVADVHTDGNTSQVLEEGVGYVNLLVAAFPTPDGRTLLGVGPVFSYYEFKWPMNDRLTDEKWTNLLFTAQNPAPPAWTHSFLSPVVQPPEVVAPDFTLLPPANNENGLINLRWTASPARRYRAFYSEDLLNWYLLQTPVIAENNLAGILDPSASAARKRFYRVQLVP